MRVMTVTIAIIMINNIRNELQCDVCDCNQHVATDWMVLAGEFEMWSVERVFGNLYEAHEIVVCEWNDWSIVWTLWSIQRLQHISDYAWSFKLIQWNYLLHIWIRTSLSLQKWSMNRISSVYLDWLTWLRNWEQIVLGFQCCLVMVSLPGIFTCRIMIKPSEIHLQLIKCKSVSSGWWRSIPTLVISHSQYT